MLKEQIVATLGIELVEAVYAEYLRKIILKALDNPDSEWDDRCMDLLDKILDYKEDPNTIEVAKNVLTGIAGKLLR